jgi:NAD(P)-dependent dehydrogenase (short-subunit alcohol dehydrogenase family)
MAGKTCHTLVFHNVSRLPVTPSFRLDGRRALITGAGRGIGLAIATAFADAGAHVTLCARSEPEITAIVAALRDRGHTADAFILDVTQTAKFANKISVTEAFDIFLNNAGTNRPGPFIEVSEENFDLVTGLNVRAAFFAAQAVVKRLISAGKAGSIINMSSQMGRTGAANRSLYCATKWAMEGFTRAMAIELGPFNIRVNTLCPTFIETPMTASFFEDEEFKQSVLRKIKIGRIGQVEDLMGAALFLASDASAMMTGSSLVIDGGWTTD